MKNKFFVFFVLAFVAIALAVSAANVLADQWYEYSVPDIDEMTVYVNGEMVWHGYCNPDSEPSIGRWICTTYQYAPMGLERGETATVRVSFIANTDLEETTVHTWITGYHKDIEAESPMFDVFAGNSYTRTLNLKIPDDLDARDEYTLYVQIEHQQDLSGIDEADVDTEIQRIANIIDILSVEIYDGGYYYGNKFNAGDTVYVNTVIKNRGNYEAEDVYARVSINELGIQRTVYVGDLESGDDDDEDAKQVTVALSLPMNIKAGTYTLEVYAYNDEVSDREIRNLFVKGPSQEESGQGEPVKGKVEVVSQISSNKIEQGKGAVYTLLVANFGSTTQNFVVETTGTEGWSTPTITPSAFSLASGQSKLVNIYVAVSEEAVEGEHVFSARVRYGNEVSQVNLVANVVEEKGKLDTKTIFMIVGIILAIVIVVLLIVLLTKGKAKTEAVESYY